MRRPPRPFNIAFAGGPSTGKTTAAKQLQIALQAAGYDYGFISEESRKLYRRYGHFRRPFERFFVWRLQEHDERTRAGSNGFVTDAPLFQLYAAAKIHARTKKDIVAVQELRKMSAALDDRYQLIVMARNPREFRYHHDTSRGRRRIPRRVKHGIIRRFVRHHWPQRLMFVQGLPDQRVQQVCRRLRRSGFRLD